MQVGIFAPSLVERQAHTRIRSESPRPSPLVSSPYLLCPWIRSEEGMVREYGVAAVANACAHPVLAGRAKELGAIAQMRALLGNSEASHSLADNTRNIRTNLVGRRQRAETVLARLTGKGYGSSGSGGRGGGGDIEEGGEGASKVRLQFYTFKWGTKPSISFTMSPKDWVWAIAAFCFWSAIVSAVLRPIMTF